MAEEHPGNVKGKKSGTEDAFGDWVSPVRQGRESGCRVYIDGLTLRSAFKAAGIPEDTPIEDLEVRRYVLHKGGSMGQVLLKFRIKSKPKPKPEVQTAICPSCGDRVEVRDGRLLGHGPGPSDSADPRYRECPASGAEIDG